MVRAVCLLSHPIPATNNAASVQIILPQKQARPHAAELSAYDMPVCLSPRCLCPLPHLQFLPC